MARGAAGKSAAAGTKDRATIRVPAKAVPCAAGPTLQSCVFVHTGENTGSDMDGHRANAGHGAEFGDDAATTKAESARGMARSENGVAKVDSEAGARGNLPMALADAP